MRMRMPRVSWVSALLLIACLEVSTSRELEGQDSQPARSTPDTVRILGQCLECAAIIVPALWRTVEVDSASLENLMWVSAAVLDRRIEQAMTSVAADTTKPTLVRAAALQTLLGYGTPGIVGLVKTSTVPGLAWDIAYTDYITAKVERRVGTEPLAPDFEAQLLSTLHRLKASLLRQTGETRTPAQAALLSKINFGISLYTLDAPSKI